MIVVKEDLRQKSTSLHKNHSKIPSITKVHNTVSQPTAASMTTKYAYRLQHTNTLQRNCINPYGLENGACDQFDYKVTLYKLPKFYNEPTTICKTMKTLGQPTTTARNTKKIMACRSDPKRSMEFLK